MLGHNSQQNQYPLEPRSEGNEGGEDSSYSGSYSFSYPGTRAPGTSDRKIRRKTTYCRPPVRILPSMRELIASNRTTSMSMPDYHDGTPVDSLKNVCISSERDKSDLQYDDTAPLEPMPDTDTFPHVTIRPTLLSTPMQPPVEPESRSLHKENKIIPLLENMEHLSHGLDWLMKSAHKNRQKTRQHEHQTENNKVIEQCTKLEQNRNYYETPSKGLSIQSNYMTPRNKECSGVNEDIKKSTSHAIKSSIDSTQETQPSLGCKKLFPSCINEIGVFTSSCPNTKVPNSVHKTSVPQYLLEAVEPTENHAVMMTPLKHESESGVNRQPHHVATNGKPILRDVVNNNVDEIHSRTPSIKMQLPSYSDPRIFHQTRGLDENKENEMNHVHQDRLAAENHFNLEPLNLNLKDTNGVHFPRPVVSNVLHSCNGSDLKVIKPSIGADSILAVEALPTSRPTAFPSKATPQQPNNETMPPMVKIHVQPPNFVGALHPKPVHPVSQPSLRSLEMPPPLSKVDPPLKKTLPATGSQSSRPVIGDDRPGRPTTDQDLDNVMFSLPVAKSATNEVIRVKQQTYTVLSQLGRGGSSVVYQVINNKTQAQVAIKRVNLVGVDQVSAQGYLNEIQVLRKLQKCESVIRLFDYEYVKSTQTLLVVMEKGDTDFSSLLKDINKTKKISVLMIAYYWSEMLNAVKSIHENGIIHSDLKPANFLLVAGRLKLIDFGIASSLNMDMTSVVKSNIIGTFNYMSPEAVAAGMGQSEQGGGKITFKSDIWSLGCILYNLVYGRTPFADVTNGLAKLIKINDPNHVIRFTPLADYPPILVTVMKICLSYDPRHRPTAAELLNAPYLPKLEDPYLMERIRRVVTPDVWDKIREVSGEK